MKKTSKTLLILAVLIAPLFAPAQAAAQGSVGGDRAALVALYEATDGANWTNNTNWLTDAPLAEWYGVATDDAGRVINLFLWTNGLTGPIPNEIGNLTNLEVLRLTNNDLTGPIPIALGKLTNLEGLSLGGNNLTGSIPDFLGNLTNLEELRLSSNDLTGPIPIALGKLTNLEELSLGRNNLTGDAIPDFLGNLTNLKWLYLGSSNLTGSIPDFLGNLTNLEGLSLGWNNLTGAIPDFLGNLTNLEELHLSGNDLTGPIPIALGKLTNLEELRLSDNNLTGPIPITLGNLTNLESLRLLVNNLTGSIPDSLGKLTNLEELALGSNNLTGAIPDFLGNLTNLEELDLSINDLTGPIPIALGNLTNLEELILMYNWGLTGTLPPGLRSAESLERLWVDVTQVCAPAAWRDWLATIIDFVVRPCGDEAVTVDVAVVYTPAAREAAGGAAEIEAMIDLMVAETNLAFAASGVRHRVALASRAEVQYAETGDSGVDLYRLRDPSDGHMDEVHALRDRVGADLVHLIVDADKANVWGIANLGGAFGLTIHTGGGYTFAHELGHNLGLLHERYLVHHHEGGASSHPAYGYVNQRPFVEDAPESSGWLTLMAYGTQCVDADVPCSELLRFSNSRQLHEGDPLGVPWKGDGASGVTGPADAAAVLDATAPMAAWWRDPVARPNRPPTTVGTLSSVTLAPGGTTEIDVSRAFADPDGDALVYSVSSSAPAVVTVAAAGARVTLTGVAVGTATVTVTATDPGGLRAEQSFTATVTDRPLVTFTDHPIQPGITPIRAVHFTELRERIDELRRAAGLAPLAWTDPMLTAGVTRVRLAHLLELRQALAAAYAAAGRPAPVWTAAAPAGGSTPIRAAHLMELRAAVAALE